MRKMLPVLMISFLTLTTVNIYSQATRTWVSGVGDDVNPCSRTAPCKTLAGAITKTAVGGEINVLDPGGFGAVNITKSITIDGGGIIGSILSSAVNGVVINAPDGLVTFRNFSINGAGTVKGNNGIKVMTVKKLVVENCTLSNFLEYGIDISTGGTSDIVISNVIIHHSREGIGRSDTAGYMMIDNCHIQGIQNTGIIVNGKASISNSVISGCNTGVVAGTGSIVQLTGNIISNNTTALFGPGKINSSGNNSITGNKTQESTPGLVKMQ